MKKFIDEQGLQTLWNKVKDYVNENGGSGDTVLRLDSVGLDLIYLINSDTPSSTRTATTEEQAFFADFFTRLQNGEKLTGISSTYAAYESHTFLRLVFASSGWLAFEISDTQEDAFTSYAMTYDFNDHTLLFYKKIVKQTNVRCDSIIGEILGSNINRELTTEEATILKRFVDDSSLNCLYGEIDGMGSLSAYKQICAMIEDDTGATISSIYIVAFSMLLETSSLMIMALVDINNIAGQLSIMSVDLGANGDIDVSGFDNRITNLETSVRGHESSLNYLDQRITDVNTQVVQNKENISQVQEDIDNLQSQIDEIPNTYATRVDLDDYLSKNTASSTYATKTDLNSYATINNVAYRITEAMNNFGDYADETYAIKNDTILRLDSVAIDLLNLFLTTSNYSSRSLTDAELSFFNEFRSRANNDERITGFYTSYPDANMTAYLMLNLIDNELLDFSVVNADTSDNIRVFGISVNLGTTTIRFRKSEVDQTQAITDLSINGKTITYTKGDGSTDTLTTQDTTYSKMTSGYLGLGKPANFYHQSTATYNGGSFASSPCDTSAAQTIKINTVSNNADRYYGIEADKEGRLFVNVPWTGGSGGITQATMEQYVETALSDFYADKISSRNYYQHTISITALATGVKVNVVFTVISKSSATFTMSSLYGLYGNKAFQASGLYNSSNVVSKIAITSSTQARFVYGASGSTSVETVTTLSDTVIPIM